jgi:hypothetical protein
MTHSAELNLLICKLGDKLHDVHNIQLVAIWKYIPLRHSSEVNTYSIHREN